MKRIRLRVGVIDVPLKSTVFCSLGAVLAAGALAVTAATPAQAVAFDLDNDGIRLEPYTWNISSAPFGVASASYSMGGQSYTDAFDSTVFSTWVEDENNETLTTPSQLLCLNAQLSEADTDGDVTISCDPTGAVAGLEMQGEMRLYAEGDLMRTLVTVSNPTTETLEFSWSLTVDFFGGTDQRATSTTPSLGDHAATAADSWAYNAQAASLNSLLAWGLPGASAPVEWVREYDSSTVVLVSDRDVDGEQFALAAGESVSFAFFHKLDAVGTTASRQEFTETALPVQEPADPEPADTEPTGTEPTDSEPTDSEPTDTEPTDTEPTDTEPTGAGSSADAIAAVAAEFSTFSGRLSRGLPEGVLVANWEHVTPADEPELAETGSDAGVSSALVIMASSLMGLGVVLLIVRRLRAHKSKRSAAPAAPTANATLSA